ncbi:hypothetical protein FQR65_LT05453 [Abscondita terminalis]|nr:hypothetical protein FQR65_LT05453 [Abscondita terminalis]
MNFNDIESVCSDNAEKNTRHWFDWIPARMVLYLLALSNVAIMYMIRVTLSVTILAMVKEIPNNQKFNVTETLCSDNGNRTFVETFRFIWPALYSSIGIWIPTQERSRFVTCFQGSALGITLLNVVAGFTIAELGWVYVFYGTGGLGLLSALLWYLLMHDKPEQHPRITKHELQYIKNNREKCLHSEKVIPLSSILTSSSVWAIAVSAFGRLWILAIFTTYSPLYFKTMIGVSVEKIGSIIGFCTFTGYLSSFLFAYISDRIVSHKLMSLIHNRKMFSVIGQILSGSLILMLGYVEHCNAPLVITLVYLIQFFLMANFVGCMSNIIDISPSHTGPVTSLVQIILLLPTVLSTFVFKTFLENENNLQAWKHTFSIACGVAVIAAIFYGVFASAKVQPWDVPKSFRNLPDPNAKKCLLKT